ncbi:MAG: GGDEF domain-containing protein [Proteobacteria bacterium]|nr:GGDEF domain-containing protein [Pseudomonadota bacterium]
MSRFNQILFGNVDFEASEEHLEFQYRFLCIVILVGAVLTALLVAGSHSQVNKINPLHVRSMSIFTVGSVAFWLALRGRKHWFLRVGWAYELFCMLEYVSALYYVSEDEFRVVWFLTNIPGVYLLLGQRVGLVITLATAIGLVIGNPYLPAPYSPNAVATLLCSVIYLGLFFHFYSSRSISYFLRMRESNKQLYELAMHDQLTGVLNGRAYYQVCDKMILLAQRSGAPYSVLFIDLDHFKTVNDTYGHAAGDLVLQTAARCVADKLRKSDSLGRIGGEEFSVFLPDTPVDSAVQIAEKIRRAIAALEIPIEADVRVKISASIGVAGRQGNVQTLKDIQQQADSAMYEAKRGGRNRVSCFGGALAA